MLQNKHAVIYLLACTQVNTVCLHLEQAFETILKEMYLDTEVHKETIILLSKTCIGLVSSMRPLAQKLMSHAMLCYSCTFM